MDQHDRGRGEFERALDHFARIDRRVVDGAGLLDLIGDQLVALVEEQDAELLLVGNSRELCRFARLCICLQLSL
jgi:hypothetical protein